MTRPLLGLTLSALVCTGALLPPGRGEPERTEHARVSARGDAAQAAPGPPDAVGHPLFLSPHAAPIAVSGGLVFVANTPADTVDVIDAAKRAVVARVNVGINPAGIAIRPDGKEVWVANHISDSVSVIDADPSSPTRFQVLATVQDLDPASRSTRFDEPVGIAFASNAKAYVALSSENVIAVVDVAARRVVKRLVIPAQDPRAIVVRGERLYVIPFESNNKTQLSGGVPPFDGNLVTFDAYEHSVRNNNVLSLGAVVDIVKHPKVPDRDLFVFDTKTDALVRVVDSLGTLLYGLAVDSKGRVYIAQTDARNDVNGRAGTRKHGMKELENRPFLNRITAVSFRGDKPETPRFIDLEPLPPKQPAPGTALATPFAIQMSGDDTTLVASAAGSDVLFTVDAATGRVLGRTKVGALPEGIALESSAEGKPLRAWVLNAGADCVSLVDVSRPAEPKVLATVELDDPTHPVVKRGRIAFGSAAVSTTGTFSCESCHPNGHTDQLLWVLETPIVTGGNQIMPRSTMPIRGIRDTAPYHWDGTLGDPYGGINSASIRKKLPPNCRAENEEFATRHLVDDSVAKISTAVDDKTVNDEGKRGRFSAAERDALAKFLFSIPFPPAQRRAYTNVLSSNATRGFKLFHVDGDLDPSKSRPFVCGDCHRMPYLVSTNTPGTGMDAPTWRGAYDRWLILPQGRLNMIEFPFFRSVAEKGTPEREVWRFSWAGRRRFDPVWDMVLEGSTGFSGAYARQVTLNRESAGTAQTADLLDALERAAREGAIVFQGEGVFLDDGKAALVALQFDAQFKGGSYVKRDGDRAAFTRAELTALASSGRFLGTLSARLGVKSDVDNPQPALWTLGPIERQSGHQEFPILVGNGTTMTLSGRHIQPGAHVIVDGNRVEGKVNRDAETVRVELAARPAVGTHFLQVQNPDGLLSNDFIFHVVENQSESDDIKGRTLGTLFRRYRWDRLIGTWVDAESKGAARITTYSWKIKDHLIEVHTEEKRNESVALIALNAESGDVTFMGADHHGTAFLGTWAIQENGDAVVELQSPGDSAHKRVFKARYHLADNDTLELSIEVPVSIRLTMSRSK